MEAQQSGLGSLLNYSTQQIKPSGSLKRGILRLQVDSSNSRKHLQITWCAWLRLGLDWCPLNVCSMYASRNVTFRTQLCPEVGRTLEAQSRSISLTSLPAVYVLWW